MRRHLFILALATLAIFTTTFAQEPNSPKEVKIDDIGRLPESFEMSLDSLYQHRYREYYNLSKRNQPDNKSTRTLDQLYQKRLHAMESAIPLTYNPIVREAIELYVNKRSNMLSQMLAKATYFFPIIEAALDKHGMPLELKYLAIVESALNPTAVSRAGATGLWQFMLPTGKAYGLHIDSMVDERRDPYKSSEAMARYFQDMYALYGDWMLSIAAYNCGPGNVNKAIRRSGGKTDFWQIYQYLPRETRSYVPFFIAAFYAMEHYDQHDIHPRVVNVPLATDTVHINFRLSFEEICEASGVSMDMIEELNPMYKKGIIPGNNCTLILRLPTTEATNFSIIKDQLYQRLLAKEAIQQQLDASTATAKSNEPKAKAKQSVRYYTVKRGDTLGGIARKYKGVTVSKIQKANNLKGTRINPGQRLVIP